MASDGVVAGVLAEDLAQQRIELSAPNRSRRKLRTQDGRPLRRYKRRWKVGRSFARLENFRRILTRHDQNVLNYLGFVLLGRIVILLRRCL